MPTYITWAVLGMVCYSFGTFSVKLAERSGAPSSSIVLTVATTIVALASIAVVVLRGELKALFFDLGSGSLFWAIMAGLALAIAVSSLFHALSLGRPMWWCLSTACLSSAVRCSALFFSASP
jgi:transporter family protein